MEGVSGSLSDPDSSKGKRGGTCFSLPEDALVLEGVLVEEAEGLLGEAADWVLGGLGIMFFFIFLQTWHIIRLLEGEGLEAFFCFLLLYKASLRVTSFCLLRCLIWGVRKEIGGGKHLGDGTSSEISMHSLEAHLKRYLFGFDGGAATVRMVFGVGWTKSRFNPGGKEDNRLSRMVSENLFGNPLQLAKSERLKVREDGGLADSCTTKARELGFSGSWAMGFWESWEEAIFRVVI